MRKYLFPLLALLGYLCWYFSQSIGIATDDQGNPLSLATYLIPNFIRDIPLAYKVCKGSIALISIVPFVLIFHPTWRVHSELGLSLKGFGIGLLVGSLLTLPMFVTNAIAGHWALTWDSFVKSLWAGWSEEILYRAFLFGMLFRHCRWGFTWAILIPAFLFGTGHLYQGHDWLSSLMAFGVTALGAFLYSWLYVEWNFNLWLPIWLHAMMDMAWVSFIVGDGGYGASGNLWTNIGRLITLALTIGVTIWYKHRQKKRCFDYKVV